MLSLQIVDEKWDQLASHTTIPKDLFIKILKFCIVDCNYFSYDNRFHRQISGLPMGSPLAPILADIVMEQLLDKTIEPHFNIKVTTKYVDDIFCIIPKDQQTHILEHLNKWHPQIQFTMETEQNSQLPYLDTLIIRENNSLIIDWYQKSTTSGRILNYLSSHPPAQITNTAKNLIQRILDISHEKFHNKNITTIKKILKYNNFPKHKIETLLRQYFEPKPTNTNDETNENKKYYISTHYIPQLTETLQKIITPHNNQVKLAPKTTNSLKKCFSYLKDKVPNAIKSNVVYNIPCDGNVTERCSAQYIGHTQTYLKTRLSAHKSNHKIKNINATALSEHCLKSGHMPSIKNTKIVHIENNYKKRLLLESLYINHTQNTINKKTDTSNIHQYKSIMGAKKEKWVG